MLIKKITVERLDKTNAEAQYDEFAWFLSVCIKDGHILGKEHRIVSLPDAFEAYVSVPEEGAFDKSTYNSYMTGAIKKLANVSLAEPVIQSLQNSIDIESCACADPISYILFTNFMSVQSPVSCGSCWGQVPLYRLTHYETHEEFHETLSWQNHYQAWDTLFMTSADERLAAKQMSNLQSNLSKDGRNICKRIEDATGKPTYYFLFHYYGRSLKSEHARKCPGCGGEWRLEETWHKFFDFRCDKCRLLSTISAEFEH